MHLTPYGLWVWTMTSRRLAGSTVRISAPLVRIGPHSIQRGQSPLFIAHSIKKSSKAALISKRLALDAFQNIFLSAPLLAVCSACAVHIVFPTPTSDGHPIQAQYRKFANINGYSKENRIFATANTMCSKETSPLSALFLQKRR